MSIGKEHLECDSQKYEVAELNLIAGKRALKTLSFNSASAHLLSGVSLLPGDCWKHHYKLSLDLHDAAVEALCAIGDFSRLGTLVSKILAKANVFHDKLNAYQNRMRSLKASCLPKEAISECLFIIGELGEQLPAQQQLTSEVLVAEYMQVKNILTTHSEEDILQLPVMNNGRKLATMEFLHMIIPSCVNTNPLLGVVATW